MAHYLIQDDKFEYSLTLAPFRPQHRNTYKYEVRVSTVAVFPFIQMKLCSICSTEVQIHTCLNLFITVCDTLHVAYVSTFSSEQKEKHNISGEIYLACRAA